MAKKLFAHNSFIGGQVDRELIGKTENAMSYSRNVVSSLKGELRPRTGTRLLSRLESKTTLVPFRIDANDILLEFSDKRVRGFTFDSNNNKIPFQINAGEQPTFPTTGWTGNTNGEWTVGGSFTQTDFYNAVLSGQALNKIQNLKKGQYFYIQSTSPHIINSLHVAFSSSGRDFSGFRPHEYYLYNAQLQYSDDGTHWFGVETKISNIESSTWYGNEHLTNEDYSSSYVFDLKNTRHFTKHHYWRIYFADYRNSGITNNTPAPNFVLRISNILYLSDEQQPFDLETDITEEDLSNIRYTQMQNDMFFAFETRAPSILSYKDSAFTITDFTPSGTTDIWSKNGYPACVSVYAGRLWFAGFTEFKNRAIASEFNNPQNFTIKTTDVVGTDPISVDGRRLKSRIKNMFGAEKALYLLSEDGVSMIDAPDGTIVSTTMIEMQLRNQEPAAAMQPTVKDDIMLYLGFNQKKLLTTDYDFVVQRFRANNISFNYTDFFKNGISELQYIPATPALIYGSCNDGTWFSLLFVEQVANALFPFETSGKIIDILALKYNDSTKLLMVVQRNGVFCLEEKEAESSLTQQYLETPEAEQEHSKNKVMSEFYMDMVQHINIDNIEFPDRISFDADKLTITTTENNQNIYNMGIQTGCEMYLQDKQTQQTLHVRLKGIENAETNEFSVFLLDDSEITTSTSFYPKVRAQTKIVQILDSPATEFEVVGDGEYIGKFILNNGVINLEKPLWNLFYGLPYEKIGVITEIGNPMTRKTWGSVSLVVQDTLHLQIGARQDKLESLIEYKPTGSEYNTVPKMTSGAITKNIADTDEYVKNLILYSDKALPFCVIGLVADGSISDMGGN